MDDPLPICNEKYLAWFENKNLSSSLDFCTIMFMSFVYKNQFRSITNHINFGFEAKYEIPGF